VLGFLGRAAAACSTAELAPEHAGKSRGEATEVGMLEAARALGIDVAVTRRESHRRALYRFDPKLRLMSTVDERDDGGLTVHAKGAPEEVLERSTMIGGPADHVPMTVAHRREVEEVVARYAAQGLRVLAVARRRLPPGAPPPERREDAERELCLLGLIALFDPPRAEVAEAVARCHEAGVRIIVVTGDHGLTAAEIARRVGIGGETPLVVTDDELEAMNERELDALLREGEEIVFARSSPEAKLRIADALRAEGHIVAMTGDGVNDAPALRGGTSRPTGRAPTWPRGLRRSSTDDNFATIVAAVGGPRSSRQSVSPSTSSPHHAGGCPVPRLRDVRRADPAAADRAPDPRHRPRH
jgi:magnesium-transporting ATPase (P-type)